MNIQAISIGISPNFGKKSKYHGGKLHKEFLQTSDKTRRCRTHNKNQRAEDKFMRQIKTVYNKIDKPSELEKEINYIEFEFFNKTSGLDINSKKVTPNKKFK